MITPPLFLRNLRYRLFYKALTARGYPLLELGNKSTECAWVFCPDGLKETSIVYSGGVGKDISFEHALVKQFGCSVLLLDPSPTGLETMKLPDNQIPQFKFEAIALSGEVGTLKFAPPSCEEEGSWSIQRKDSASFEVPCVNLSTLMRRNKHSSLDLLKIDIEGSEYAVIDDLIKNRLQVKQLLVEFHHGNIHLPGIERKDTVRAILKLRSAGYQLINQSGSNHSFILKNQPRQPAG